MGPLGASDTRTRRQPRGLTVLLMTLLWLLVSAAVAVALFATGTRTTVLAGHDAEVRASLDSYATFDLGPYLPSFRVPSGHRVGARVDLGATELDAYDELVERYALLAARPEAQAAKLRATLVDLAVDSALLGGLVGLGAPGVMLLVGPRRWAELRRGPSRRRAVAATAVLAVAVGTFVATRGGNGAPVREGDWQTLSAALPDVRVPGEAVHIEVEAGLVTSGTRRLVESAVATYRTSLEFYGDLVSAAPGLSGRLRTPAADDTVALLVSDRHDNVGMDPVARAVADAGGATVLLDAGDDTSTGGSWEAFSLESLAAAFEDFEDRYVVAGNHDNGDFVTDTFAELGFTTLVGEVVEGPDGISLLGAADVRSSGLGAWRDENGDVSFSEQRTLLADLACEQDAADRRISTLLVHDASSGAQALERGCVDLVLAGHLHERVGPEAVVGENGRTGYRYTNGTTGGAAYAVALGSKLRRDAEMTLVTYTDGRPAGLQAVVVHTDGDFTVTDWIPLELDEAATG